MSERFRGSEMTNSLIETHQNGATLHVTINRPEKANALTRQMLLDLRDVFSAAAKDRDLRAVVVSGAGGRVFCAGADLSSLSDDDDGPDPWAVMAEALNAIPVLTIAAINGPCMGGGLTLALDCDVRSGVPAARFSYPVLKNNVVPGQYDIDRLAALIGPGRAAAILLGGTTVQADEAVAWGLIDRLVEADALQRVCAEVARPAASASYEHLAALKSMLGKVAR